MARRTKPAHHVHLHPQVFHAPSVEALQFAGDDFRDPSTPHYDKEKLVPNAQKRFTDSPLFHCATTICKHFSGVTHLRAAEPPHHYLPELRLADGKKVHPGDWVYRGADGKVHSLSDGEFRTRYPRSEESDGESENDQSPSKEE